MRYRIRLYIVALFLSLCCNFQYAFSTTYSNSAHDEIKKGMLASGSSLIFDKWETYWNVFLNLWFVGFLAGLWKARWMTDTYGRKAAFISGCILNIIGSLGRCLALHLYIPWLLLAARTINAFATGCTYQCLILYLQEAPPTSCRGAASIMNSICFALVSILGVTLGNSSVLGRKIDILTAIPLVNCVYLCMLMFFIPETPKYLVLKGKKEQASDSFAFFHGKNANVQHMVNQDHGAVSFSYAYSDFIREAALRKALYLSLAALQNTVAFWPIIMSSSFILERIGIEKHWAQWASTSMTVAYTAGAIASAFIIDKLGRRPLLIWTAVVNLGCLLAYTILSEFSQDNAFVQSGCLGCFIVYGFTYGAGVGPVGRFISTELTPLKYRSGMCTITYSANTVGTLLLTYAFLPLFAVIGAWAFVALYVAPSTVCCVYLYLHLPETKNREIRDVVLELQSKAKIHASA